MSTSKMQKRVSKILFARYEKYGLVENTRPDWLYSATGERLELDFFIESLDIAIEVQGGQHFQYSPHFHGSYQEFINQQKRDVRKRETCSKMAIKLFEIITSQDIRFVVEQIDEVIGSLKQEADVKESSSEDIVLIVRRLNNNIIRMESVLRDENSELVVRQTIAKGRDILLNFGVDALQHMPDRGRKYMDTLKALQKKHESVKPIPAQKVKKAKTNNSVVENEVTYEWLKRDIAVKRRNQKLHRAKNDLQIAPIKRNTYRVWGGETEHIVQVTIDGIICDCRGYSQGSQCSHIIKYLLWKDETAG